MNSSLGSLSISALSLSTFDMVFPLRPDNVPSTAGIERPEEPHRPVDRIRDGRPDLHPGALPPPPKAARFPPRTSLLGSSKACQRAGREPSDPVSEPEPQFPLWSCAYSTSMPRFEVSRPTLPLSGRRASNASPSVRCTAKLCRPLTFRLGSVSMAAPLDEGLDDAHKRKVHGAQEFRHVCHDLL